MSKKQRGINNKAVAKAMNVGRAMAVETLKRRATVAKHRKGAILAERALRAGATSTGVLVAEGDSWFHYPFFDILSKLEDDHGYDVEAVAHRGDTVEDMAYADGQLDAFARRIEKVLQRGQKPKAILLSGGGNDVAGDAFAYLLNHATSPKPGINDAVVSGIIDERLQASYLTIIAAVTELCTKLTGAVVPIILHGYDYPVPDGRGYAGGWWLLPGPWLEPSFVRKGYESKDERQRIVVTLIDRFNAMLTRVAAQQPHVRYLNLRRKLSSDPKDYKEFWGNEMHPTKKGFEIIANEFARVLRTV